MTSQPKSSSKWGNFFQQAVAGVESRLDTILAEDERPSPKPIDPLLKSGHEEGGSKAFERSISPSASSKTVVSGGDEALQERLAKAVGSRPQSKHTQLPQDGKRRTGSPSQTPDNFESMPKDKGTEIQEGQLNSDTVDNGRASGVLWVDGRSNGLGGNTIDHIPATVAAGERSTLDAQMFSDKSRSNHGAHAPNYQEPLSRHLSLVGREDFIEQGRAEVGAIERQERNDATIFLEDIESLQAKLKFLAQELFKGADNTIDNTGSSDLQQQLAQKDKQIALFVQEGTRLSQNEVKLLSNNRKLKAGMTELEKASLSSARADMTSLAESKILKEEVENSRKVERDSAQAKDSIASMKAEIHRLLKQLETKDNQILDLRDQMRRDMSSATLEEGERWKDRVSTERKRASEVEEELSSLRLDNDAAIARSKLQIHELETKLEYESKSKAKVEIDLKGEIQSLESRLESFRARAEENSSEISYDVQAKLVRQIETLQGSYTVANENWRGIESSLMSRITTLEREQAEVDKRETDSRRRTREATARCRELETRLAQETTRTQELEGVTEQQAEELTLLRKNLTSAKSDLLAAQQQLASLAKEQHVRSLAVTVGSDLTGTNAASYKLEDNAPIQTPMSQDNAAHTRHSIANQSYRPYNSSLSSSDHGAAKSPLTQTRNLSYTYDSDALAPQYFSRHSSSGLFTAHQDHSEDMFDGVVTPATPERTINDVLSTSTAAAGPSVQLVERMSAAMRRLESEKAASKDDIDRLAKQRDEAREQVTALMTELAGKQAVEERVHKLEAESQDLGLRLQTTLEMLGERSELVEELKADIADMKDIYRATLEDTVK